MNPELSLCVCVCALYPCQETNPNPNPANNFTGNNEFNVWINGTVCKEKVRGAFD